MDFMTILGVLIVALYNVWNLDWRLIINILKWITFLEEATMLIIAEFSYQIKHSQLDKS